MLDYIIIGGGSAGCVSYIFTKDIFGRHLVKAAFVTLYRYFWSIHIFSFLY